MIRKFTGGRFGVNLYVIYDGKEKSCAIVDPGEYLPEAVRFIESKQLKVEAIILTHGHGDHLVRLPEYLARFDAPVLAHRREKELLDNPELNFSTMMIGTPITVEPDRWLEDGDEIVIGAMTWKVLHTPGHTKGGICLHHEDWLIAGDTLFKEAVGRFDLHGGDYRQLKQAIQEKLMTLPDDVVVYPGHGPETTIGYEREHNRLIG